MSHETASTVATSSVAGATFLLDFHRDRYDPRGEPHRSELAVTAVIGRPDGVAGGTAAACAQKLERHDLHVPVDAGHSRAVIGDRADRACHVSTVSVAIDAVSSVTDRIIGRNSPAAEFDVRRADTGVNDISVHTRSRLRIDKRTVQRKVALVDAVQAPDRSGKIIRDGCDRIFLNKFHSRIAAKPFCVACRHLP